MNNRSTILYLLLGIALALLAHFYISYGGGEKLTSRTTVFDSSMLEADKIVVERSDGGIIELLRRESSWHMVKPFAADADQANVARMLDALVLRKIVETYSDKYLLKSGKRRLDFGLSNPTLKISVTKDCNSASVLLGDRTPDGGGVFAFIEGDTAMYVLDRDVIEFSDIGSDGFRSHKLLESGVESINMFDVKRVNQPIMNFIRVNGRWVSRTDGNTSVNTPASNTEIDEFLSALAKAKAKSFVWPVGSSNEPPIVTAPLLAGYGLDSESGTTVTVYGKVGSEYRIVLGKEAENGLVYALVQNSSAVAMVDGLLKDLAIKKDFSDLRLFPLDASTVTRITISDNGVDYLLERQSNDEWIMDSPVSAPTDGKEVSVLLNRILGATVTDRDEKGITVSVSTNLPAERISSDVLPSQFSFASLRSRQIARFDPSDIKRIVSSEEGSETGSSVIFDKDRRTWIVENSTSGTAVREESVVSILNMLQSLDAVSIVSLKATEAELKEFALDKPRYTISVDFFKENSLRRNIFIGERTATGYYATTGSAFDAVFILSDGDVSRITAPLVTE